MIHRTGRPASLRHQRARDLARSPRTYGLGDDTTDDSATQAVVDKFTQALDLNAQAKQGLADNKASIVALADKAKQISDPDQQAQIQAQIQQHLQNYLNVLNFYNDAAQKLSSFNDFVKNLFAQSGVQLPGLGFLPAIPAVWVAVIVAVGVALTAVLVSVNMHAGAIADTDKVIDSMLAGQITPTQAAQAIQALNQQVADQNDQLGIKSALGTVGKLAVPILLILAAIFVLPQVLGTARALRGRA
jgi:hypothetical protein